MKEILKILKVQKQMDTKLFNQSSQKDFLNRVKYQQTSKIPTKHDLDFNNLFKIHFS